MLDRHQRAGIVAQPHTHDFGHRVSPLFLL
jgi:hypothetical protein